MRRALNARAWEAPDDGRYTVKAKTNSSSNHEIPGERQTPKRAAASEGLACEGPLARGQQQPRGRSERGAPARAAREREGHAQHAPQVAGHFFLPFLFSHWPCSERGGRRGRERVGGEGGAG